MTVHVRAHRRHRRRRPIVAAGLALAAWLAAAEPATAANHRILLDGLGTSQADDVGTAVAGAATGKPFDGAYAGVLVASDGTPPAPGECEPAGATLHLDGSRSRFVELDAGGKVCGRWTDASSRVTHVFTGRYVVTASSVRRLNGTDGFFEVRLTDDGRASIFAIDT